MEKKTLPKPNSITTTIDSHLSEFDLSYSDGIKEFIAQEMDIDINLLKNLTCVYFSVFKRVSDNFAISNFSDCGPVGAFQPSDNLLLVLSDDTDLDEKTSVLSHEVGHFLSLNNLSVTIAEACALIYERNWAKKNHKIDYFNKKYKALENYWASLKLLDMIKVNVFDNNEIEFQKCTKRGADNIFADRVDKYLKFKGCKMNFLELFFLIDVLFYKRDGRNSMKQAFKENPPYFYKLFDDLHNDILPILFDKNASIEQIKVVNECLMKCKKIIDFSFEALSDIKIICSDRDYITFVKLYQQILAQKFHECDVQEYFNGKYSGDTLANIIKNSVIEAVETVSYIFMKHKENSSIYTGKIK